MNNFLKVQVTNDLDFSLYVLNTQYIRHYDNYHLHPLCTS